MAVQPPPAAIVPQQAVPPNSQKSSGCFGRGCGCSLLGCAGVVVLATLLVLGSGYWFLVVQASAAVTAPATLVVYNQPVTVDHKGATPGQALNAGNEVATQAKGHAAIQFPDGSFVRMSPDTTVRSRPSSFRRTAACSRPRSRKRSGAHSSTCGTSSAGRPSRSVAIPSARRCAALSSRCSSARTTRT